jgi:hypothetical protein
MNPSFRLKPKCWLPHWRVCVCVLLAALVLFNPFSLLKGSSGQRSYDELARNRASIGSSELQHFSPVSNPDVQPELAVDVQGARSAVCAQEEQPVRARREVLPPQPALLAGVWFRPPPSL